MANYRSMARLRAKQREMKRMMPQFMRLALNRRLWMIKHPHGPYESMPQEWF